MRNYGELESRSSMYGSKEKGFSVKYTIDSSYESFKNYSLEQSNGSSSRLGLRISHQLNSIKKNLRFDQEQGKLTIEKAKLENSITKKTQSTNKVIRADTNPKNKLNYLKDPILRKNLGLHLRKNENIMDKNKFMKSKIKKRHGTPLRKKPSIDQLEKLDTLKLKEIWRLYKDGSTKWKSRFIELEKSVVKNEKNETIYPIKLEFGPLKLTFNNHRFSILYFIIHSNEYKTPKDVLMFFKHSNVSAEVDDFKSDTIKRMRAKENKILSKPSNKNQNMNKFMNRLEAKTIKKDVNKNEANIEFEKMLIDCESINSDTEEKKNLNLEINTDLKVNKNNKGKELLSLSADRRSSEELFVKSKSKKKNPVCITSKKYRWNESLRKKKQ